MSYTGQVSGHGLRVLQGNVCLCETLPLQRRIVLFLPELLGMSTCVAVYVKRKQFSCQYILKKMCITVLEMTRKMLKVAVFFLI